MYPSFLTHLPEDGHMSDSNLWVVYYVYNIFSYTYVNLLVLAPISNCSLHSNGSFKADPYIACHAYAVILPCRALIHICYAAPLVWQYCVLRESPHGSQKYLKSQSNSLTRRLFCSVLLPLFTVVGMDRCEEDCYLLTPWCRVLLEKLTGLQLVKKFPAFHGTRRFIIALTSLRHLSLYWASPIQSIYPHPTSWRSNLILSTHLCLGLPIGLLPSGFPSKTLYTLTHMRHMPSPSHSSRFYHPHNNGWGVQII